VEIIEKRLAELTPYKNNPRKNDQAVDAVAASIKAFGWRVPIVIDKDGVIVCGHTRAKAAKKLKLESVPCVVADDLTEDEIKAFRLADNKVGELAEWDLPALDLELADLDFDMGEFGFGLLDDDYTKPDEVKEDDFDEDPPAEPKSKRGEIYLLGNHRLMCGDSTSAEDVEKLMDGEKADIAFTSPPYNAGVSLSHNQNVTKYISDSDNKTLLEYRQFLKDFTENSLAFSDFSFVNIQSLANNKVALIDYLYDMREKYADTIIWDKGAIAQPAMAHKVLNSRFEYIHIFSHNGTRAIGTKDFRGTIDNVLTIQAQRNNEYKKEHNATFPIAFASFFVENFSNKSVIDLFGGTGTTIIACEQLGRKCYAMELEPKYIDLIIARWGKFTGRKAEKI